VTISILPWLNAIIRTAGRSQIAAGNRRGNSITAAILEGSLPPLLCSAAHPASLLSGTYMLLDRKLRPKAPPMRDALSYTLPGASALSGLSVATLRRRAKDGDLRLVRVGSRTLVAGDSLRRMLGVE
jgi:hypothetical protein